MSKKQIITSIQTFLYQGMLWGISVGVALFSAFFYHVPQYVIPRLPFAAGRIPSNREIGLITCAACTISAIAFLMTGVGRALCKQIKQAFREYRYLTLPPLKQIGYLVFFVMITSAVLGYVVQILDACLLKGFVLKISGVTIRS